MYLEKAAFVTGEILHVDGGCVRRLPVGGARMWPDRRLVDLFEIEHPIVLAPMAGLGTIGLAASVCEAGGLGSIGCATMQPQLAAQDNSGVAGADEQTNQRQLLLPCPGEVRRLIVSTLGRIGCCPITVSLGLITNRRTPAWISHRSAMPCARSSRTPSLKW